MDVVLVAGVPPDGPVPDVVGVSILKMMNVSERVCVCVCVCVCAGNNPYKGIIMHKLS
jgi:hypothetical protein